MEVPSNFNQDVLVVLVIYEMKISASPTFQSLEKALRSNNQQVDLLIYDNSRIRQDPPTSNFCTTNYQHNANNGGVSLAYNKGFELAKEKNKKWLLLFDQDDVFGPETLLDYENGIKSSPSKEVFIPRIRDQKSFLSPFKFIFGGGKRIKEVNPGVYALNSFFFINSGLLISTQAFEMVGGYSDDFPLDFSDLDFIIRLRKKLNSVVVLPIVLEHSLSSGSKEGIVEKVNRFRSYLQAANRFQVSHGRHSRFMTTRTLLRVLKLSWQFKSMQFLKTYYSINF